jgi:hypothetical protein
MFTDKRGNVFLDELKSIYEDLISDRDFSSLEADESSAITRKLTAFLDLRKESLGSEEILTNREIPYLDEWFQVDYLGLSSESTGVISLLLDDANKLNIEVLADIENPSKVQEFKEDQLTAKIEAISSVTQGMTVSAYPRWIAVKIKFQHYRFLTFKKYSNDYLLYFLSEGNLDMHQQAEEEVEPFLRKVISRPFTNELAPFNKVKEELKRFFTSIPERKFK